MPRVLGINVYDFIPFKQLCLCTVEGSVVIKNGFVRDQVSMLLEQVRFCKF